MSRTVRVLLLLPMLLAAEPVALTVSPAGPPRNVYRWQLLPPLVRQKSGDAVAELVKAAAAFQALLPEGPARFQLYDDIENLRQLPLAELDAKKVRALLAKFQPPLEQLENALYCERADWDFMLDRLRKAGIGAILNEVQEARNFLPYLALKARLALREDRPEEAVRLVGLTLALARLVNQCPGFIPHLVALTIEGIALDLLAECVQHPQCPSLYGVLTELPRPLLTVQRAYQGDRLMLYATIPGLLRLMQDPVGTELDRKTVDDLLRVYRQLREDRPARLGQDLVDRVILSQAMKQKQAVAHAALRSAGYTEAQLEKMPLLNASLLHAILAYDEALSPVLAVADLPYYQARTVYERLPKQADLRKPRPDHPDAPAIDLPWWVLLPAFDRIVLTDLRVQRQVEMLRVVEALREHAAQTGQWPDRLEDLQAPALPRDPGTGKPFGYTRAGEVATLEAPEPFPNAGDKHQRTLNLTLRRPAEKTPGR